MGEVQHNPRERIGTPGASYRYTGILHTYPVEANFNCWEPPKSLY